MQHSVLVIAYYFPPMGSSGVQRIAKFVKYLPEYGWRPHVLATGPTAYYAHDPSLLEELEQADIQITRTDGADPASLLKDRGTIAMPAEWIRKTLSRISNTLLIPDNKRGWAQRALAVARELTSTTSFDAILVSGPPFSTMMAGAQLSAETGIPLVLDYRDLWYGNQFHTYPTLWHAHKHQRMEHATLARAANVVVTNRRIKERLLGTYKHLDFNDVAIIPQGFDPADLQSRPTVADLPSRSTVADLQSRPTVADLPSRSIVADLQSRPTNADRPSRSPAFRLTYAGIFYDVVTPVPFFKAIRALRKERPDMALELHFAGLLRDEYRKKARRMGLADLIVDHGYLPHRETVQLLQESDALWMMVGHTRNADTISSGKLYEYFGTRKPLLVSVPEGALQSDAEKYGAAWITAPDDVQAIASAISDLYDRWKAGTLPTPDERFVQRFDRRVLAGDLARVLAGSLRV